MRRGFLILVFASVVFASGCIGPDGGGAESPIEVTSLTVTPSSIGEGSSTSVSISIENRGEHEVELEYGERGRRILADYCRDDFDIEEGSFSVSTNGEELDGERVRLQPDRRASFDWELRHTGEVEGQIGSDCQLRFESPFEYTVSTYQEIEILEDENVEPSEQHPRSTSSGPLIFGMRAGQEGHAPAFPGGEEDIPVLLELQHYEQEGRGGIVDIKPETLNVYGTDPLEFNETLEVDGRSVNPVILGDYETPRCDFGSTSDFRLNRGTSRIINCQVPAPEVDLPARTADVGAQMEYEYNQEVARFNLEVRDLG